ncbi:MAG: hypothetical protein QOJ65_445 [Fimbriimonadaceae bacterium]|jgi:hypothetical protein|nr:hypothetical protein [Fimbriimonadaceae bacterium]
MQIRIAWCAALAVLAACSSAQSLFDAKDRRTVKQTLDKEVHLEVGTPPYADRRGAWQVRLTAEGSKWLYAYSRAKAPADADRSGWASWIDAKYAFDRAAAAQRVAELNGEKVASQKTKAQPISEYDFDDEGSVGGMEEVPAETVEQSPSKGNDDLGPMPDGLRDLLGDAPLFVAAVKPQLYKISFGDEPPVSFIDQAPVRPKYLYFRSGDGVISGGTPIKTLPEDQVRDLCEKAGINESTWRVMRAVSSLEGGFDSINTYDTGYVSVGFIQFTTGQNGNGSLGSVLLQEKTQDPDAFQKDFKRYGIDVTDKGVLAVYDAEHDEELVGKDAVLEVMKDKRLSGVFVRAGKLSEAFRIAQLRLAKDRYYAGDDIVTLKLDEKDVDLRVGDVIKSEAGLAILMDRKVNTGNIRMLSSVLQNVAEECAAKCADDLAAYEDQIVASVRFRRDFLADTTLSQPGASERSLNNLSSRGGSYPRAARKKKAKDR